MPLTDQECEQVDREFTMRHKQEMETYGSGFVHGYTMTWLSQRLPNVEDRTRYHQWWKAQTLRENQARPTPRRPDASEYLKAVRNTVLTDDRSTSKLMQLFSCEPASSIGIGMHKGTRYRLVPSTDELIVDEEHINWEDKREIVDQVFLGVNTMIETKIAGTKREAGRHRRREEATSEESNSSNDSTILNDSSGFTFVQLGMVEGLTDTYYQDMKRKNVPEENMGWEDTTFVLVAMIASGGTASEGWLIYNFKPRHSIEGTRYPIDENSVSWGLLVNDSEQRAGFKIADEVWKLGPDVVWSIEKVMHKYDLVAAVIAQQQMGKMVVRQKLFTDSSQKGKIKGKMPLKR